MKCVIYSVLAGLTLLPLALSGGGAHAATVFLDDFDDGDTAGWTSGCERLDNFSAFPDSCQPALAVDGGVQLKGRGSCFSAPDNGVAPTLFRNLNLPAGEYVFTHDVFHSTFNYNNCSTTTSGASVVLYGVPSLGGAACGVGNQCATCSAGPVSRRTCLLHPGGNRIFKLRTSGGVCAEVTGFFDNIRVDTGEAPELLVPPDVEVGCGEDTEPESTGFASASDDCAAAPSVTWTDSESDTCPRIITRTWMASDGFNVAMADQLITIIDAEDPVLDLSLRTACIWPPSGTFACWPDVSAPVSASDDCGIESLTVLCASDQAEGAEPDCTYDPETDTLCARRERDGWNLAGRTYSVSFIAQDACGNSAEAVGLEIRVPHSLRTAVGCGRN